MTTDVIQAIVEDTATHWAKALWFYTFGGVIECAQFAFARMHLKALEFFCSIMLMTFGFWMLLPATAKGAIPFIQIMQVPLFGTPWDIPLWVTGIIHILVARIMMYYTRTEDPYYRGIWLLVSAIAWAIMFWFNMLSATSYETFAQFPNGLTFVMAATSIYLMVQSGKIICENDAHKKAE